MLDRHAAAFEGIIWMALLMLAIGLAAGGLWSLKRRMSSAHSSPEGVLSLHALRGLHRRGRITKVEYQALRRRSVESIDKDAHQST